MKAEILAVGTEILLGDIVNTNAQYLAKELANLGIFVYHQGVIGDNEERLQEALKSSFTRSDLVIATGGLGPTKDDMTKEVAAKYFGRELVMDMDSRQIIEGFFTRRNLPVSEGNLKQALFPKDCIILPNPNGTAPGCIIEAEGKILVLMPGPPREMKPMFQNHVVPYLSKYQDCMLVSKVLRLCCIGESMMEERIKDLIENQSNPTIAPYAKEGEVTLRLTAKASTPEQAHDIIKPVEDEIYKRLGRHIYGVNDDTLEGVVAQRLLENNLTISVAESCSGGMLSSRLINYPGISKVFLEGAVCYSNQAKVNRLGVKEETLDKYGAVSAQTAIEMAQGIAKTSGSDIGISITGIAGPEGGTEQKPVGLVFVGLYIKGQSKVEELNLFGNRQRIRAFSTTYALDFLRKNL